MNQLKLWMIDALAAGLVTTRAGVVLTAPIGGQV